VTHDAANGSLVDLDDNGNDDEFPDSAWDIPDELTLVVASYEVIGGTGSPGGDDSGKSTLFFHGGDVWVAHTDPDEIERVDEESIEAAIEWLLRCYPPNMPHNMVSLSWGPAAASVPRARFPRISNEP